RKHASELENPDPHGPGGRRLARLRGRERQAAGESIRRRAGCARRSPRLRSEAEFASALRTDTPPSAVASRRSAARRGSMLLKTAIGYNLATVGPPTLTPMQIEKGRNLLWLRPLYRVGATGLEPVTPSVSNKGTPDAGETDKGLTAAAPSACTTACNSTVATQNAGTVGTPAAAPLRLSAADPARRAPMPKA